MAKMKSGLWDIKENKLDPQHETAVWWSQIWWQNELQAKTVSEVAL